MLTLTLFVLAVVCGIIAIVLHRDPVAAIPVMFLGIMYFVLAALFLVLATW